MTRVKARCKTCQHRVPLVGVQAGSWCPVLLCKVTCQTVACAKRLPDRVTDKSDPNRHYTKVKSEHS